jgi:arylsulfatase A-like enzyme
MGKIYHGGLNDSASWSVPWQVPAAAKYALPPPVNSPAGKSGKKPKNRPDSKTPGVDEEAGRKGMVYECADVPDDTYQDGKVAALARTTLKDLSQKPEPFFLAVGFIKPHLPWVAPKKYWDLYDESKIKLAPNSFLPHGAPEYAVRQFDGEIYQYQGMSSKKEDVPDALARKLRHAYYASVSYMDAQVGLLLDELKRLGIEQNTIIILWGDHGWKLGEHRAWGKHTNVENDVNAPLILSVPGAKTAGAHCAALVEFVDIYPTLSELAGLPLPAHLEGISLKPLLDNPERPWKSAAFSQYPRGALMGYSMRTGRYRFTVWADQQDPAKVDAIELYDHQTDPQENTNIAKNPDDAGLVSKLMQQWKLGWQGARP